MKNAEIIKLIAQISPEFVKFVEDSADKFDDASVRFGRLPISLQRTLKETKGSGSSSDHIAAAFFSLSERHNLNEKTLLDLSKEAERIGGEAQYSSVFEQLFRFGIGEEADRAGLSFGSALYFAREILFGISERAARQSFSSGWFVSLLFSGVAPEEIAITEAEGKLLEREMVGRGNEREEKGRRRI
jgi:hypothetical protein